MDEKNLKDRRLMELTLKTYNKLIDMFNATEEDASVAVQILKSIYGTRKPETTEILEYNDSVEIAHQLILKNIRKYTYRYKNLCVIPFQFQMVTFEDLAEKIKELPESSQKEHYKVIYKKVISDLIIETFADNPRIKLTVDYIWP